MTGRIASLNCSKGGVPKLAVPEAWAGVSGMEGDRQRDLRFHGGPERALSLYSLELIEQLQAEGHPIVPGAAGENVTMSGVDWRRVLPGTELRLGEVSVLVTSYAAPCTTIRRAFLNEEFIRISQKLHPGWSRVYARVLREGRLVAGTPVEFEGVLAGL
jgi:MOSC domain-containing protein YiiM